MRIGTGYDVHKLVKERKLIVGGVDISYEFGLEGHSDADVLLHAIMDALLGAAALGDIGKHFPDNDETYKGICSINLLKRVAELILKEGYYIENIDSVIIAQSPKFAPYIEQMRKNIADSVQIDISRVSVKATTEEGLGFTGRKEGIAAHAVCLIEDIKSYGYENNALAASYNPNTGECEIPNKCTGCKGCSSKGKL